MGLPQSPTELGNLALDELRQKPITSIEPPYTDIEKLVARQYDIAREFVFRNTIPNFAKTRATCPRLAEAPLFDFTDAYQMPNNYIRLLSVDDVDDMRQRDHYDITGRSILMNKAGAVSIDLRFVADVLDISKWEPNFRDAVVLKLAANLAYPITGKASVVARVEAKLEKLWPLLISIDGQERPPYRVQHSKALAARRGANGRDNTRFSS